MLDALKITSRMKAVPTGFPAIKPTLNDYTWDEINKISEGDLWDLYGIQVGDTKTISVNFIGKSGDIDCFIIGINHNEKFEGKGATFQVGKQKGVKVVMSQNYIKDYNSNSGGWKNSYMRETVCKNFFNALPSDLQAVIKETTKYSNNKGQDSSASAITATKDKIFIPALFEVMSQPITPTSGAFAINGFEQAYQKVYDYYLINKSLAAFGRDSISSQYEWWLRSVAAETPDSFFYIYRDSSIYIWAIDYGQASNEKGFCPCFKV